MYEQTKNQCKKFDFMLVNFSDENIYINTMRLYMSAYDFFVRNTRKVIKTLDMKSCNVISRRPTQSMSGILNQNGSEAAGRVVAWLACG